MNNNINDDNSSDLPHCRESTRGGILHFPRPRYRLSLLGDHRVIVKHLHTYERARTGCYSWHSAFSICDRIGFFDAVRCNRNSILGWVHAPISHWRGYIVQLPSQHTFGKTRDRKMDGQLIASAKSRMEADCVQTSAALHLARMNFAPISGNCISNSSDAPSSILPRARVAPLRESLFSVVMVQGYVLVRFPFASAVMLCVMMCWLVVGL